jgi:hypothetical protein
MVTHTPQEIQQLKINSDYILSKFDNLGDIKSQWFLMLISSVMVFILSFLHFEVAMIVYAVLGLFVSLVTTNMWNTYMNVYSLHMNNDKINEMGDKTMTSVYKSMIYTYKNIGLIVGTTTIEVFFLITYMESIGLAIFWGSVCSITAVSSISQHKKYFQIKKVNKYATENS